jgi:hypothetical protein
MVMTQLFTPSSENAPKARAILEKKIEDGRISAGRLIERLNTDAPRDAIIDGRALHFMPGDQGKGLKISRGGGALTVHRHALNQLGGRASIPTAYLSNLVEAGGWQTELAVDILGKHYANGGAQKYLARTVQKELRGFLSDKFRRLDSRPLVDAFAMECQKIGAVPVDGTVSDVKVALKAIVPTVYEPVPGEVMAFGLEWHNSDFVAGLHSVRARHAHVGFNASGCGRGDARAQTD